MKRNKLFILGICTVMVALVSLSLVSGTWARYTSTVSGEDSAAVAKWAWKYNDGNMNLTDDEITIEVFQTKVYELDGSHNVTTNEDEEVREGYIAPLSGGQFQFSFENESDVVGEVAYSFAVDKDGIKLEFSTNNADWSEDITTLDHTVELGLDSAADTYVVYWRWVSNGTDALDTTVGIESTNYTPTVTVNVTFTQVD